jgi:hypothetical protein
MIRRFGVCKVKVNEGSCAEQHNTLIATVKSKRFLSHVRPNGNVGLELFGHTNTKLMKHTKILFTPLQVLGLPAITLFNDFHKKITKLLMNL